MSKEQFLVFSWCALLRHLAEFAFKFLSTCICSIRHHFHFGMKNCIEHFKEYYSCNYYARSLPPLSLSLHLPLLSADMTDAFAQDDLTFENAQSIAENILGRTPLRPQIGIICETGLDAVSEAVTESVVISYSDLPGFPQSTGTRAMKISAGSSVTDHLKLARDYFLSISFADVRRVEQ